jgi:hypothetical protein
MPMKKRRVTVRLTALAGATLVLASPLAADEEAEKTLKRFFEGRSVVARLDMPATSSGIDVYPEREDPLDYGKVGDRVRSNGVAVREGERTTVTRVKVKDDLIEFQLGGGGFNSFKDSSGSVSVPYIPKSSLEKDLERELREETDSRRRRQIQRELDDLRREREAEDARNRAMAEMANAERRERDERRALQMGSRFNIRFEKKDVPPAYLSPEGVMRALDKYVDFRDLGHRTPERPEDLRLEPAEGASSASPGEDFAVRKGMTRAEVEAIHGEPLREDESQEGVLTVQVASYGRGGSRFEVTYVEGVVVRVMPLEPQ